MATQIQICKPRTAFGDLSFQSHMCPFSPWGFSYMNKKGTEPIKQLCKTHLATVSPQEPLTLNILCTWKRINFIKSLLKLSLPTSAASSLFILLRPLWPPGCSRTFQALPAQNPLLLLLHLDCSSPLQHTAKLWLPSHLHSKLLPAVRRDHLSSHPTQQPPALPACSALPSQHRSPPHMLRTFYPLLNHLMHWASVKRHFSLCLGLCSLLECLAQGSSFQ